MPRFLTKRGVSQEAGAVPSPGSVRREGFLLVLRRTGALDFERSFAVRCSDVRDTGRFARVGREAAREDPVRLEPRPSDGGRDDARRCG